MIATKTVQPGVWTEIRTRFATPKNTSDLLFSLNTDSTADFWIDEFKATRTMLESQLIVSATPANIGLKDIYANHFRYCNTQMVTYLDEENAEDTEEFALTLIYTDAQGAVQFRRIAATTVTRGQYSQLHRSRMHDRAL